MQEWEYTIITTVGLNEKNLLETLKYHGSRGWEVCTAFSEKNTFGFDAQHLILKRIKEPKQKGNVRYDHPDNKK